MAVILTKLMDKHIIKLKLHMETNNKKTPLYEEHLKLGAKIVGFAGFSMPLYYKSIIEEHLNVRNNSGLFDISHMGEILIKGKDSTKFLEHILTAGIAELKPNNITYSLMLNDNGGIIDDLTVYKFAGNDYMVVTNAVNTDKDFSWISLQKRSFDVDAKNMTDKIGLLSIQGPRSRDIVYPLILNHFRQGHCGLFDFKYAAKPVSELNHFEFSCAKFKYINVPAMISRSGYTGEFGFEIFISSSDIKSLWSYFIKNAALSNLLPVGLGARDTLRFEAALPLYGNELDETITPYDAGLERFLSQTKDFIGKEPLEKVKNKEKKLIFFKLSGKQIPRHLQKILDENLKPIGCVASGTYSPTNKIPIGSAYISDIHTSPASLKNFFIDIRGNFEKAEVINPPFLHRKHRKINKSTNK